MNASDPVDTMSYVLFKLGAGVADDGVPPLLRAIDAWPAVIEVGQLRPKSPRPSSRRHCFVQVNSAAQAEFVAEALRAMPEVEAAAVPAQRFAMAGRVFDQQAANS